MKTMSRIRAGSIAGLFVLAALTLMIVAPTAGAMRYPPGPTTGSGVSVSQTDKGTSAGTRAFTGRGAIASQAPLALDPVTPVPQPPSGVSSTTAWMAAAAVLGALLIVTWAPVRSRRGRLEASPDCAYTLAGC